MSTVEGLWGAPEQVRGRVNSYIEAVRDYVIASVPPVTARTLGVARMAFGACMLYFWLFDTRPESLGDLSRNGPLKPFLQILDQTGILTALSASPSARTLIYWAITALLVAFIAGAMTRIVYAAFVCLFWLACFLQNNGHGHTPLMLALVATLPVPWGERWSVDALVRGRPAEPPVATPFYGYGIWLLGLTIGITYTTAGLSKLVVTEGGWLWNTGARNGFIQDFGIAATDWGMILANNYFLAFCASVLAAFGQMIYVYSSFTRCSLIKYAICFGIAIPFATGLVLFMGHFWWAWIILIVMLYLPWASIDRFVARDRQVFRDFGGSARANWHQRWFLTAGFCLVALHGYAVATKGEYEPLYSNYQMYAEGMRAGSEHEEQFWSQYRKGGRHFKYAIEVVGNDSVRELGNYYHLAWNLDRFRLWHLNAAQLLPMDVVQRVKDGTPIGPEFCSTLQAVASSYLPGQEPARSIRLAKRYIDMVDGKMVWTPIDNWIEVDLTAPGCSYRNVQEAASSASPSRS